MRLGCCVAVPVVRRRPAGGPFGLSQFRPRTVLAERASLSPLRSSDGPRRPGKAGVPRWLAGAGWSSHLSHESRWLGSFRARCAFARRPARRPPAPSLPDREAKSMDVPRRLLPPQGGGGGVDGAQPWRCERVPERMRSRRRITRATLIHEIDASTTRRLRAPERRTRSHRHGGPQAPTSLQPAREVTR